MKIKKPGASEGGLSDMIVKHVEKGVLGVMALMVFVLIYFGWQRKPIEVSLAPDQIKSAVSSARSNIENTETWDRVYQERFVAKEHNLYDEKAERDLALIPHEPYSLPNYFRKLIFPPAIKRTDPQVFTVTELRAVPGVAAIAMRADKLPADVVAAAAARRRLVAAGGGPRNAESLIITSGAAGQRDQPVLDPRYESELRKTFRPPGAESSVAVGRHFVAVQGLVPLKKQWDEFDRCFLEADSYEPGRDRPKYIFYYVERAELGADGQPGDWRRIGNSTSAKRLVDDWAGSPEDPAAPEYTHPELTMPVPPILLASIDRFALHPKIPRRKAVRVETETPGAPAAQPEEDHDLPSGLPAPLPGRPAPAPPTPGRRPPSRGDSVFGDDGRAAAGDVAEMPEGMDRRVEHLLFRYFDLTADPRKQYVYRVQLLLEDPNDPQPPSSPLPTNALSDEVILRIAERRTKEQSTGRREFWRESPWSEATVSVRFPDPRSVLAGPTAAPRDVLVPGEDFTVRIDEAKATVLGLRWDASQAARIPGKMKDVYRGALLNLLGREDLWVLDPVLLSFRKADSGPYDLRTDHVLLDIRGGAVLPSSDRRSRQSEPGRILLLGPKGQLIVRDEVEDSDQFRRFDYLPDREGGAAPRPRPREEDGGLPGGFGDLIPGA